MAGPPSKQQCLSASVFALSSPIEFLGCPIASPSGQLHIAIPALINVGRCQRMHETCPGIALDALLLHALNRGRGNGPVRRTFSSQKFSSQKRVAVSSLERCFVTALHCSKVAPGARCIAPASKEGPSNLGRILFPPHMYTMGTGWISPSSISFSVSFSHLQRGNPSLSRNWAIFRALHRSGAGGEQTLSRSNFPLRGRLRCSLLFFPLLGGSAQVLMGVRELVFGLL